VWLIRKTFLSWPHIFILGMKFTKNWVIGVFIRHVQTIVVGSYWYL
jgi:hypothetical protein